MKSAIELNPEDLQAGTEVVYRNSETHTLEGKKSTFTVVDDIEINTCIVSPPRKIKGKYYVLVAGIGDWVPLLNISIK